MQPFDKILQSQGFGTRKYCQRLIRSGEVLIDGVAQTNERLLLEVNGLTFSLLGQTWLYRKQVYIAMNKPMSIECSRKPSHHKGVMSLLPEPFQWRGVQAVGRLDHDTTGLLLLTDDGAWNHAMSSPKRHVPKVYLATIRDAVTQSLIDQLLSGVQLHDEPAPISALYCEQWSSHQLRIVLEQGKYHQVKRMLASVGNECAALHREKIGQLSLAELALEPGQWCYLTEEQLKKLGAGFNERE